MFNIPQQQTFREELGALWMILYARAKIKIIPRVFAAIWRSLALSDGHASDHELAASSQKVVYFSGPLLVGWVINFL